MHTFCGLDFGTSNTTIGIYQNNDYQLVPLDAEKPIIRSAIFCDTEEKEWVFGQNGINLYLEGIPGRLMMALKTVLGSSLMNEKTVIFNEYIPYTAVLNQFLTHIKTTAEKLAASDLTQVVLGRPVHFHDHDKNQDQLAQDTLELIAKDIGFKEVSFQFEPIAAALHYEITINREQLALIVDMGGGTSDFSIIRLHTNKTSVDRKNDVLANEGIHIAGTDFDKKLSLHYVMPLLGMGSLMRGASNDIEVPSSYYHDLTTWHTLANLYGATNLTRVQSIESMAYEKQKITRLVNVLKTRGGHHILDAVESSKQKLSDVQDLRLNLSFIEPALDTMITRRVFNTIIQDDLDNILKTIKDTVKSAAVQFTDIDAIFYTGGSTKIPLFREHINSLFPNAAIAQGDAFGSVGMGLTIDAKRKYGTTSKK